jgi:hypothetical protein
MRKIIFLLLSILVFVSVASVVSAEETYNSEVIPDFNPVCWKQKDCEMARSNMGVKGEDGWLENQEPCDKKGWGMCLPAGETVTSISFGGKTNFANVGEFLKHNYNLALVVAGILASIMIIISGMQWMTAGGNSEMINRSKKRIGGAVIGLLIAYLSYVILNTINPALVNLRLPQAWLVREQILPSKFCYAAPSGTKFEFAAKKDQVVDKKTMVDKKFDQNLDVTKFGCGDQYFLEKGNGATCIGSSCDKGKLCMPIITKGGNMTDKYDCVKAQMITRYTLDSSLQQQLVGSIPVVNWFTEIAETGDWLDNTTFVFWGVCESVSSKKLYVGDKWEQWDEDDGMTLTKNKKGKYYEYYLTIFNLHPELDPHTRDAEFWECKDGDKLVGFVYKSEMGNAYSTIDSNFYVSEKGVVNIWESISKNGYISLSSLKNGVVIEASITSNLLPVLSDNRTTEPTELGVDGTSSDW